LSFGENTRCRTVVLLRNFGKPEETEVSPAPYFPMSFPRWRPDLSCCCSYLEQSAPTRHVRTFYVCFSESSESFSLQAFIPMTFTATFVVPAQWPCHLRTF